MGNPEAEDSIREFKNSFDENIRSMMEVMKQDWYSIMLMPYEFFLETLKWKANLEETKNKRIQEEIGKPKKTIKGNKGDKEARLNNLKRLRGIG